MTQVTFYFYFLNFAYLKLFINHYAYIHNKTHIFLRFILQAVENNIPIAMINIGETRADKLLTLKVEARCGEVLKHILI